jgi:hypothetical protein
MDRNLVPGLDRPGIAKGLRENLCQRLVKLRKSYGFCVGWALHPRLSFRTANGLVFSAKKKNQARANELTRFHACAERA